MRRNTRNFHLVALALILSLAGVAWPRRTQR